MSAGCAVAASWSPLAVAAPAADGGAAAGAGLLLLLLLLAGFVLLALLFEAAKLWIGAQFFAGRPADFSQAFRTAAGSAAYQTLLAVLFLALAALGILPPAVAVLIFIVAAVLGVVLITSRVFRVGFFRAILIQLGFYIVLFVVLFLFGLVSGLLGGLGARRQRLRQERAPVRPTPVTALVRPAGRGATGAVRWS